MAISTHCSLGSICGLLLLLICATEGSSVWGDIGNAMIKSPATFHEVVDPLSEMCSLVYVATKGSYYREGYDKWEVSGFDKDEALSVEQPQGGMRAFVFVDEEESGPAVVAFRGTDVNANTPGGQADLCIDYIMGGVPSKSLPKYCANFTAVELDYFSQAKAVVNSTLAKYPKREIVLTGHSLGCTLAAMMSIQFRKKVVGVCFSLPGTLTYAAERTGLSREKVLGLKNLYVLSDSNDPLTIEAVLVDGLYGQPFVWDTPGTKDCCKCCQTLHSESSGGAFDDPNCSVCFSSKHGFSNYRKLIEKPEVVAVATPDPQSLAKCTCPTTGTLL